MVVLRRILLLLILSFSKQSFQESKNQLLMRRLSGLPIYNDKPIAFFILLPDLNQIIKHFNGKLQFLEYDRFVWFQDNSQDDQNAGNCRRCKSHHIRTAALNQPFSISLYQVFRHKPWYKELELSWVGDFNPKMIAIYEALGAQKAKMHITYRYLINNKLTFIRYKDEMAQKMNNWKIMNS